MNHVVLSNEEYNILIESCTASLNLLEEKNETMKEIRQEIWKEKAIIFKNTRK